MRQLAIVGVVAAALGAACLNSQAPKGFTVQYAIAIYGCGTSCDAPGPEGLTFATRGDTVWVRHDVSLISALEPTAYARVRADCEENATVETGTGAVRVSLPASSCPDSLETHDFVADSVITRQDRWIIDSSLAATGPTAYAVIGHILVRRRRRCVTSTGSRPVRCTPSDLGAGESCQTVPQARRRWSRVHRNRGRRDDTGGCASAR